MNNLQNSCVFLDRDGTVVADYGYVYKTNDLVFMPGVPEGLLILKKMGFVLVIITNQSGVARGFFTLDDVVHFHNEMNKRLYSLIKVKIDAFYICPHHECGIIKPFNVKCSCRKPSPYLFIEAAREHQIDLNRSYMIGNEDCDARSGYAAGLRKVYLIDEHQSFLDIVRNIAKDVQLM